MNIDWGSAVATVLTGAISALLLWLSPRLSPVARWSKDVERDLALLEKMPDSAAKTAYAIEIDMQVSRITNYREKNTGWVRVMRTGLVCYCLCWYVVMVAVIISTAQYADDSSGIFGLIPPYLWLFGLLALGAIIWILTGASDGRLPQPSKAPAVPAQSAAVVRPQPPVRSLVALAATGVTSLAVGAAISRAINPAKTDTTNN